MEEGEGSRKSRRSESDFSGEGAFKMPRQEMEHLTTGRGRSSMPCREYFSIAGCRFGERCHFSHDAFYGYNASAPDASAIPNFAEEKTLLCYNFSHGGCVVSEKCPYAHGEGELRGLITYFRIPDETVPMPISGIADHCLKPQTRFGATAKSSASITTTRTSTKGMDSRLCARVSGTEISLEEDESDHSMLNIKIKGALDDVKLAILLVQDHIVPPRHASILTNCLKPQTGFGATAKSSASITTTRSSTKDMDSQIYAGMSGTEISLEEDESDHSLLNIKIKGTLDKVQLAIQLVQDHIAPPNGPNSYARHE